MLIENVCRLTPEQKDFTEFVLSDGFPWFYQWSTDATKYLFFGHSLMNRNPEGAAIEGNKNSDYYDICYSIFKDFCDQNNIKVNTVLRAAVNHTSYHPDKMNEIHLDHDGIAHNNFIMYLNDFTGGSTYLFDDDHNMIKEIIPAKNRAVIFGGFPHAHGFCSPDERRVALVFTFN
jgi:hypothetical protein